MIFTPIRKTFARMLNKASTADVFATTGELQAQSGIYTMSGASPRYEIKDSVQKCNSIAYNCASRNAVGRASSPLRLFSVRATGEDLPKIAPFNRMPHREQKAIIARVRKAITPSQVARWSNGEVIEITDHPFLDLMRQVNPYRNSFDHMEETSLFEDCSGNAYWYILSGRGVQAGIPTELWLLPSQLVTIVIDQKRFIKGYMFGNNLNKGVALTPDEVIHFRRPNMANRYYGMGRIEAAFQEISGNNAITQLEWDRARTHGIQDLWFKVKNGDLTDAQRRDMEYEFANSFAANRRDPRPIITGQEVDVTNIAWSPRDLLAMGSRAFNQQIIVNAFGQSTALWNDTANRATAEAAIYSWAKFEIDPANMRMAQKLNEQLLPMYDGGDRLFCAFEPQAQEDKEFLLRQETADRTGNVRTINEIRQGRGLEPLPDDRADDAFATAAVANPFGGGAAEPEPEVQEVEA